MSFVIPLASIKFNPTQNPGPGNYDINKNRQIKISCAPFNSTSLRSKQKKKQQPKPGPGTYNNVQLKKIYQYQTLGNNMFLSKVTRFKQLDQNDIGPGYYQPKKQQLKINQNKKKKNQLMNYIRHHNHGRKTVSIKRPTNYIRIVYNDPKNTQNNIAQYVDIQFMNRNLGPGQYQINKIPQQHKRASSWSKSKVVRFKTQQKQLGDSGQQEIQEKTQKGNFKNTKNSAVFISQGVRTHFQSMIYKTNLKDLSHLREFIKYKDPNPGPGQYLQNKQQQKNQNIFQFFGSTSQRFIQNPVDNYKVQLGPGSYYQDQTIVKIYESQQKRRKRLNYLRAASTIDNNRKQKQKQKLPGPGQYDDKTGTLKQNLFQKFKSGYHGEFGIRQQRFPSKSIQRQIPGPGNYNIQQQDAKIKSQITTYISQSKRKQQKISGLPFGNYKLDYYDISKTAQKKKQFIQNLKKIQVEKPPFQSTQERFRTLPNQIQLIKEQSNLNIYPQNIQQKKLLKKPQKLKTQNSSFKYKADRFIYKIQDYPPPGHYHKKSNIQKQSYSIKYGYKKL